ncbi:MAG: hypothetical protein ABIR32_16185 [Ilumatobacteraceae bacterium]
MSAVFYVGIAMMFLTCWGVIMAGGYLLGRESTETVIEPTASGDPDLIP